MKVVSKIATESHGMTRTTAQPRQRLATTWELTHVFPITGFMNGCDNEFPNIIFPGIAHEHARYRSSGQHQRAETVCTRGASQSASAQLEGPGHAHELLRAGPDHAVTHAS